MPVFPILLLCLAAAPLCGQQRGTELRTGDRATIDSYSESRSRELFRACDADGDDRLDVFEATEAIEGIGDIKNAAAFRRIDTDRDGYLSWPEFDQHYRSVLQVGRALRLRPARRLPAAPTPTTPVVVTRTPLQQALQRFLQLYDRNQDGGLDPQELEAWVKQADLKPQFASQLRTLDSDRSGKLEEAELELFFRSAGMEALLLGATTASNAPLPGMPLPGLPLPGLPLPGAPTTGAPTPLPPLPAPWHSADLDQDGQLSRSELAHWLRQLDSGLVRWAGPILDKRDANRDQKLQATELGLPPGSPKPATAQPNRPKT